MAKEGERGGANPFRLINYSISDLLNLVRTAGAEKILLEVGYTPILFVKGQKMEIDGPDVTTEAMEELLHSVASTRQIRSLRKNGTVEFVLVYQQHQILVDFVEAFEVYRGSLTPIATIWHKPKR
jgi:Tfp pilus assembly pilus retraction ATPase PilT